MSEPTRVAGGHKATINNPNTSEEAKEHSKQVLADMEGSGELHTSRDGMKNTGNVIGGKKAAIHNASVPEETKNCLRNELEEHGVDTSEL
ncbi:hypothetical protein FRB94_000225 [Tulasnella sp. JGI-2019a]|nr:hypothetical protein FRB94_000225 [Tulasnella sp. JGI-2019a]KAG9015318.1 hypothetical protein FRB93_013018 [Tulasnella sp. JGI-2019a]KAG9039378.1 hypothetical protein FRB95_010666 [Tulasnella sp. JGI-2019a]